VDKEGYHALILAGGFGTRLWPMSQQQRAKQFLQIHSDKTLLEQTISRIRPLFPWERIWVVTKPVQVEDVLAQLPDLIRSNILIEPCPKGTAAAISWATLKIESLYPQSVIAVFPSDHLIEDEEAFRCLLDAGLFCAGSKPYLVTFGIRPTRAEPAYGYLEIGRSKEEIMGKTCYEVLTFHEKPDRETAFSYLSSETIFWNSGIFVFSSIVLFETLKKWMPAVWESLKRIRSAYASREEPSMICQYYDLMPDDSLDKGLLEKASNIVVFPGDVGWYDIGVWETYYELSNKDGDGNAIDGLVIPVGCKNCLLISGKGSLIAAVGAEDMVIVAEGNVVLVCPRDRVDEIRQIIKKIKERGLTKYL